MKTLFGNEPEKPRTPATPAVVRELKAYGWPEEKALALENRQAYAILSKLKADEQRHGVEAIPSNADRGGTAPERAAASDDIRTQLRHGTSDSLLWCVRGWAYLLSARQLREFTTALLRLVEDYPRGPSPAAGARPDPGGSRGQDSGRSPIPDRRYDRPEESVAGEADDAANGGGLGRATG